MKALPTGLALAACALFLATGWWYAMVVWPEMTKANGYGYWQMADLHPMWRATHEVLVEQRSPYREDVPAHDHFAYPLFAVFPFAPLALVSYPVAQALAFWCFLGLSVLTTWLWARLEAARCSLALCALALAPFPVIMGIVLRQPAVLFLFLLALAAWGAKSERYALGGMAAALAAAKPQLAIAVLAPLLLWTLADWSRRKLLALAFALSFTLLLAASFALQPAWFSEWLSMIAVYRTYANSAPLLGTSPPWIAAMAAALLALLWRLRRDLETAIAVSAAGCQLIVPFQAYHLPLLLPTVLWIWHRRDAFAQHHASRLAYRLVALLLLAALAASALACVVPWFWKYPALLFVEFSLLTLLVMATYAVDLRIAPRNG